MHQMTAVLASIQPLYCSLIAERLKTAEVRKNKPALEAPFKVYIYKTKAKGYSFGSGYVIGEFVCDRVDEYDCDTGFDEGLLSQSSLTASTLAKYLNGQRKAYAWHISQLTVYNTPQALNTFCGLDGSEIKSAPQSWRYCKEKEE